VRLAVAATAPFGADVLARLAASNEIAFLLTRPDAEQGRGRRLAPPPAKEAAERLGIAVHQPERPELPVEPVDAIVVCAYGLLIPSELLEQALWLNVHPSLLPRWRGAAPVERAILAGDAETGIDLMRIEAGLDTGPVFARVRVPIGPQETAGELHARLVDAGTELLRTHLPLVPDTVPEPQQGEPTYADKLTVDEFRLDPTRAASDLERLVRAGNPRPGAWLRVDGRRVKVWRARALVGPDADADVDAEPIAVGAFGRGAHLGTARGTLVLDEVQPEGKRVMDAGAWLTGVRTDARVDRV
jgi:methionyl-tRNA formyltransferase